MTLRRRRIDAYRAGWSEIIAAVDKRHLLTTSLVLDPADRRSLKTLEKAGRLAAIEYLQMKGYIK